MSRIIYTKKWKKKNERFKQLNKIKKQQHPNIYDERIKRLKTNPTQAELQTMGILQKLGIPFRFQVKIGYYIADFIGLDRLFALEIDGAYHDNHKEYDDKRDRYFKNSGFKIFRIKNSEVSEDRLKFLLELRKEQRQRINTLIGFSNNPQYMRLLANPTITTTRKFNGPLRRRTS